MPKSVFTEAYSILLKTLVALRKEKGVTQVELSRRLGKPQPWVSYMERGERRLDVIEFYAVVSALGADPEQVFSAVVRRLPKKITI